MQPAAAVSGQISLKLNKRECEEMWYQAKSDWKFLDGWNLKGVCKQSVFVSNPSFTDTKGEAKLISPSRKRFHTVFYVHLHNFPVINSRKSIFYENCS